MIFKETVAINDKQYMRTYSDTYTIMRDGVEYTEAIDPIDSGREYTETENLLEPIINEE
jgi:hypothetical protein